MTLSELFDKILERPALYVGCTSISMIAAFLAGYEFAKFDGEENVKDELYTGFKEWVPKRFGIKTSHGWANIIAFMGVGEMAAYELAKELWTEYKEQQGTKTRAK
jgi:hypothetical protein